MSMVKHLGLSIVIALLQDFSTLLDHLKDESGVIQQFIPVDPRDLGLMPGSAGIPKQRPFAAVLGCSDARVPIELIFNEGPNDLFVRDTDRQ